MSFKIALLILFASLLMLADSEYGSLTVHVPGTPVQFSATSKKVYGLYIRAKHANTGNVYIKGTNAVNSSTGVHLAKDDSIYFDFADLSQVWLDVDNADEGIEYFDKGTN